MERHTNKDDNSLAPMRAKPSPSYRAWGAVAQSHSLLPSDSPPMDRLHSQTTMLSPELSASPPSSLSPSSVSLGLRVELPSSFGMLRQSSFGVDEPMTATIKSFEEDEQHDDHGGHQQQQHQQAEERWALMPFQQSSAEEEPSERWMEQSSVTHADSNSYERSNEDALAEPSMQLLPSDGKGSALMEEWVPVPSPSSAAAARRRTASQQAQVPQLRALAAHSYQPLVTPRPIRPVHPPRVFHSFLLITVCGMMSIGELCCIMARVCKQWQRHAHDAIAHPARRMHQYAPAGGGEALFAELTRLTCKRGIRQRLDALSSTLHASLFARQAREAHHGVPVAAPSPRHPAPRVAVTSNQLPSVTLLQHLQLLPSQGHTLPKQPAQDDDLLAQVKRLLPNPVPGLTRIGDSHCLLLSTHLVHLRVLRIYNGSGVTNEGMKMLAHQLRHLRILHIGHLCDAAIDDRALQHVSENLLELHSLWLTQDTELPQRSIWNPRPRTVFNLFSTGGVARLKNLRRTLHHLNLGGFKNLTTQGLLLLSTGADPLRLQSVHLNGWHIGDECMRLLQSSQCLSLYHLHLFDVRVGGDGMRALAQLRALETLICDHCADVNDAAVETFVDEAQRQLNQAAAEREEATRSGAHAHADGDGCDGGGNSPPRGVSLLHLELTSCASLSLNALRYLSLHPTLRTLHVAGRVLTDADAGRAECTLRQVEELSAGRIVCNGGRRQRRRASNQAGSVPTRHTHNRARERASREQEARAGAQVRFCHLSSCCPAVTLLSAGSRAHPPNSVAGCTIQ